MAALICADGFCCQFSKYPADADNRAGYVQRATCTQLMLRFKRLVYCLPPVRPVDPIQGSEYCHSAIFVLHGIGRVAAENLNSGLSSY